MKRLSQIALAWELYKTNTPKTTIAHIVGCHRETVHEWIKGIEADKKGIGGFLERYEMAKKGTRKKRKLTGVVKEHIYYLRDKHHDCCGQKIQYYLEKDLGVHLSVKTIYSILTEKYVLKSKWKKYTARGPVPVADHPRQVIQMDSVDFGEIFVFTGVDIFTRDAVVQAAGSLTSLDGARFLIHAMRTQFIHTELLQTDGGSEFKDHFKRHIFTYADRFRISRPYRKNEQAYIESFNRSLRKECLGWRTYPKRELPTIQKEINAYLNYYHQERIHLGLNKQTPNQVLAYYQLPPVSYT